MDLLLSNATKIQQNNGRFLMHEYQRQFIFAKRDAHRKRTVPIILKLGI